jgi:hypothetical protein
MADLSRRDLLKKAALTAASLPAMSLITKAQNTPKQRPIVGSGDHTYEVHHDWLTPPIGIEWGDTHGVAVDSHRRIYIAHTVHPSSTKTDAILVFDDMGGFIESWGSEFKGGAHGLDIRKEGTDEFIYHCDVNRRLITKTDLKGKVIWQHGAPAEAGVYKDGAGWNPTNVAFAPDGDFFVGDGYGSHYVHRYGKDGDYKGIVIHPGAEAGKVREPHGLWVDTRSGKPKLVVADRGNNRLQEFTLDGKHIGFVKDGMRRPCHIHYNKDLALIPDLDSVVNILDKDNKVVASLGDGHPTNLRGAPRSSFIPGKFVHPHSARWINSRDILVVEWVPIGRVTLLKKV